MDLVPWLLEREFYRKLASDPVITDDTTSIEGVLARCEALGPSVSLGKGGWLFESYIIRWGKKNDFKSLRKFLMKREKLDQGESDVFVRKYSIPFWFHVITSIHKLNKFACTPLRMLTCLLEYYGLSRSGIQLLAHCDAAISPNTLDLCRTPTLQIL